MDRHGGAGLYESPMTCPMTRFSSKDILEDSKMFDTPTRLGSKIATGQVSMKL